MFVSARLIEEAKSKMFNIAKWEKQIKQKKESISNYFYY